MSVNRGKQFEDQVSTSFENVGSTSVLRLIDPQNGFAGVRNICDFVVYNFPYQYLVECKSCHGNTMSIHTNNPKNKYGMITNSQWEGLLQHSTKPGVRAGIIVWFIDHDTTYWVDIRLLERLYKLGYKSISWYPNWVIDDSVNCLWTVVPGKKRRILFDYDMSEFFRSMDLKSGDIKNE